MLRLQAQPIRPAPLQILAGNCLCWLSMYFTYQVQGNNASSTTSIPFTVTFTLGSRNIDPKTKSVSTSTQTKYTGIPCNATEWGQYYGSQLKKKFQSLYPETLYCPPPKLKQFLLFGGQLENNSHLTISVSRYVGPNAMTNSDFNSLYKGKNSHVVIYKPLFNFNLTASNGTQIFLDKSLFLNTDFDTRLQNKNVFIGIIVLDDKAVNPWPTGLSYLQDQSMVYSYPKYLFTTSIQGGLAPNQFASFSFWADSQVVYYSRTIDKIDQYLSYMGGVFQFVSMFAMFVLGDYSLLLTTLKIGKFVDFQQEKRQNKLNQQFNYFSYLKYKLFGSFSCCTNKNTMQIKMLQSYLQRISSLEYVQLRLRTLQRTVFVDDNARHKSFVRYIPVADITNEEHFYENQLHKDQETNQRLQDNTNIVRAQQILFSLQNT